MPDYILVIRKFRLDFKAKACFSFRVGLCHQSCLYCLKIQNALELKKNQKKRTKKLQN